MRRGIYLAVFSVVVLGAVIVTTGRAQVYPVRWDEQQPEPLAPTPPALVLADGGLEFPDGSVQTTAAGGPPLRLPRTGQTAIHVTGDDGDLRLGVAWPIPRFTDNGNGTVTDNLTGLIWMDDASCSVATTWDNGLAWAAALHDGCSSCGGTNNDCGLTDGSIAGQWRVPNVRELLSLVHYGAHSPCVSDTLGTGQWSEGDPFSGVLNSTYWTSTRHPTYINNAWYVYLGDPDMNDGYKENPRNIWPVRGGQ